MSSITPLTIAGTSALGLKSGGCSGLLLRYIYLVLSLEIIFAKYVLVLRMIVLQIEETNVGRGVFGAGFYEK
jgi:hypothetical protein